MSKDKSSNNNSGGIGFFGLLTTAFVVLKLTGYIAWSWLWVLSPIWIPFVFGIVLLVFFLLLNNDRF